MSVEFAGSCLCGSVTYESTAKPAMVGHCQCLDCRKSSGSGHCTHVVIPKAALTIAGDVTFYDKPADSGNMVSRGFCATCGAAVCSKNSAMPEMAFIRASSLDDLEIAKPSMVVYASRAASWDLTDPSLPTFAEAPDGGAEAAIAESMDE